MQVTWIGASGKVYTTQLCDFTRTFVRNPGIYIFCRPAGTLNQWTAIYVGETDNFDDRLCVNLRSHHQWDGIQRERATNVCCLYVPGPRATRLAIETDLRAALRPPCNRQ